MMMKEALDYSTVFSFKRGFPLPPTAASFPIHFRQKTGILETWSLFPFPEDRYPEDKFLAIYLPAIPTLMTFVASVNDLLSFYKEARNGESFNYVCNYANTHSMQPLDVVRLCSKNIQDCIRETRAVLASEPQMLRDVDHFMEGYILFHLASPRYRLSELDIPEAKEAQRLLYGKLWARPDFVIGCGSANMPVIAQDGLPSVLSAE